ncbi:MAG: adenylate/guanylate cyclase domain-containing protein [Melioribacteraceae bacterium]|nr:adenylate/guanylate cyclase domain-containing protein [Melioribacteraceae bacterium]
MKKKITFHKKFSSLGVFLISLFLSIIFTQDWFFNLSSLKELELKLIDKRFTYRGQKNISDNSSVTICTIDQQSYDQLPIELRKYPLNRRIFSKAVENLNKLGAKAIGIDVLMPTYDQFSEQNDIEFIETIRKFGNVVLSGKIDEQLESNIYYSFNDSKIKYNFGNVYYDADSSIGIVRVVPDIDNIYRRYLPSIKISSINKNIPSFGFAVLNKFYSLPKNELPQKENEFFIYYNKKIPKYDEYTFLINIYGANYTFPQIKLIDVIDDETFSTQDELDYKTEINNYEILKNDSSLVKKIKDKIILIGSTMPEDRDLLATAFSLNNIQGSNVIYGVEFHANAIQNVIDNDFIIKQNKFVAITILILIATLSFWITYLNRKIKVKFNSLIEIINILFLGVLVWGIYYLGFLIFVKQNILIEIIPLIFTVIINYFGSTTYYVLKERKQSQYIKSVFSQYVNKQVVNELISNAEKIKLGGEKKNLTVMFSDMVGFTTFAENKDPEVLVNFINTLLDELTNIIFINNGTLDKYIGDAVMAFWGAPIETEDHAYLACKSAIEMQKKVLEMSKEWEIKGEKPIKIRIGINSGNVIVGNVGGEKHKNYTVMGDEVNLASRLEGANKEYSTQIMISESTYELIKEKFIVRELDLIRVKGKTKPTKVYELIGMNDDLQSVNMFNNLENYFKALELYKQKQFESAKELFKKSYEDFNDGVSKVYLSRCEYLLKNPPENNWDNVFELTSK